MITDNKKTNRFIARLLAYVCVFAAVFCVPLPAEYMPSVVGTVSYADVVGELEYSVSTNRIVLPESGKGTFTISFPESPELYGGIECELVVSAGTKIDSVSFSQPGGSTLPPQTPPGGQKPDSVFFGFFNLEENIFSAAQTCTVNFTYTGSADAEISVHEIKRYVIIPGGTNDYVTAVPASITLVPYSDETVDPPVIPPSPPPPVNPPSTPTPTPTPSGGAGGNIGTEVGGAREVSPLERPQADVGEDGPPLAGTDFPFTDVTESDWFYGDVYYMWVNELMVGTSETLFSPNIPLTRGMAVTVLYRIQGSPNADGFENRFPDVNSTDYYYDAVKWASSEEEEIVLGYEDGTFGPLDNITREQFAAILSRYQHSTGDIPRSSAASAATVFVDELQISEYARSPVAELVGQGIINGRPGNIFDPKSGATRAEFSAMLHRYLESF